MTGEQQPHSPYSNSIGVRRGAAGLLPHSPVLRRRMEVQVQRVSRHVHMHGVVHVNRNCARALHPGALYFDLLLGERDLKVLCLLQDRFADIVVCFRAVRVVQRFGLHHVFELVVGEVRGNEQA